MWDINVLNDIWFILFLKDGVVKKFSLKLYSVCFIYLKVKVGFSKKVMFKFLVCIFFCKFGVKFIIIFIEILGNFFCIFLIYLINYV